MMLTRTPSRATSTAMVSTPTHQSASSLALARATPAWCVHENTSLYLCSSDFDSSQAPGSTCLTTCYLYPGQCQTSTPPPTIAPTTPENYTTPAPQPTTTTVTNFPCTGCYDSLVGQISDGIKAAGGVSLAFSFFEVRRACVVVCFFAHSTNHSCSVCTSHTSSGARLLSAPSTAPSSEPACVPPCLCSFLLVLDLGQ